MSEDYGRFEGDVVAKWLVNPDIDNRTMELTQSFAYIDQHGKRWEAPTGSKINGASIPPSLWGTVGTPYVGDYRRASVVHDVACENEPGTSDEAHMMFYHAMRCDGVGLTRATAMYRAVKHFGPEWKRRGVRMFAAAKCKTVERDRDVEAEFDRIVAAVNSAVQELGEDAALEQLDQQIDEILKEHHP